MINKDDLFYKIEAIIEYLKDNKGYEHKIYNRLCPDDNVEPDSNIVEYAEDVKYMINEMIKNSKNIKN